MNYKYCIAGKNDIAVNAVEYLINTLKISKNEITVVINANDNGIDSWQKSLKKFALNNNIKTSTLPEIYSIENILFISLEFDKIIKTKLFKSERLFNIHFSNLPKYKGMFTSVLPILNGETIAGVTLHKIDDGIDTGDIIKQKLFKIDVKDTARDLYFKYLKNGFSLFKNTIKNLISNDYKSTPQTNINSSYYSQKSVDFNNIKIDLHKSSFEIYNQIRAFIFAEYQLPKINDIAIKKITLTNEFIGYNKFENFPRENKIIFSGIDGFKLIAKTQKTQKT